LVADPGFDGILSVERSVLDPDSFPGAVPTPATR